MQTTVQTKHSANEKITSKNRQIQNKNKKTVQTPLAHTSNVHLMLEYLLTDDTSYESEWIPYNFHHLVYILATHVLLPIEKEFKRFAFQMCVGWFFCCCCCCCCIFSMCMELSQKKKTTTNVPFDSRQTHTHSHIDCIRSTQTHTFCMHRHCNTSMLKIPWPICRSTAMIRSYCLCILMASHGAFLIT